jgi:hypothetical protein
LGGEPEIMSCNDSDLDRPILNEGLEGTLPGEDFVQEGLADLAQGRVTDLALLVLVAGPSLRRLGIEVPERSFPQPYEHELYDRLEQRMGDAAHSYYNSLIRRIVSYAHALERERSSRNNKS